MVVIDTAEKTLHPIGEQEDTELHKVLPKFSCDGSIKSVSWEDLETDTTHKLHGENRILLDVELQQKHSRPDSERENATFKFVDTWAPVTAFEVVETGKTTCYREHVAN